MQWGGIALENYTTPAVFISRHEHPEHFLHVVSRGTVKYEVNTRGRNLRFTSRPGTIFLLPRGTVDEVNWAGPTHRMAVAIHPRLLTNALDETTHESDIELKEHWDLIDPHISALLQEMAADLEEGSPAGTIYGESLANALAVYLLKRHAVRRFAPVVYKGGLPGYRLKRVLEYIANNLETNISPGATCRRCWHESALLFGAVQTEYGSRSASLCPTAADRTCQATASRPRAQHHRGRTRRRISKLEPFRPYVSKT